MDQDNARTRKAIPVVIILLLLITIGVLIWLLLKPQPEPDKIPTGNVDVFNIDISCVCDKDEDGECDKKDDEEDENQISYSGIINNRHNTTVRDDGIVYADDANGRFVYQKDLDIFRNAAFEYTTKIAPGVSNSYDFKVHNTMKRGVRYNIVFAEDSEYAINLKYRLKEGGSYVVGSDSEWVSASELSSALTYLAGNSTDSYTLDWEWPYEGGVDAADTEAGEKMTSEYSLGIKINFEEA
jgi:hypothetical protein